jgi:hypothetical protein
MRFGIILLIWKGCIMTHTVLIVIISLVLSICVAHSEPKKESEFDRATKVAVTACGSKSNDSTYIKCLSEQRDTIIWAWKMARASKNKDRSSAAFGLCSFSAVEGWDYKNSSRWNALLQHLLYPKTTTLSPQNVLHSPEKLNWFHQATRIKECILFHQEDLK